LGFKKGDSEEMVKAMAQKILKLRIFEEVKGKMDISIEPAKGSILLVSQFTLLANTKGGNRPSFIDAEAPETARHLYELMKEELSKSVPVETVSFGNYMQNYAQLDGPVTIVLDL
jgi:D-tyrosyl-tRNA(Tyr) deacylase